MHYNYKVNQIQFLAYFQYSYPSGKYEHIYTECFFHKVVYTKYNVPWFIEFIDFTIVHYIKLKSLLFCMLLISQADEQVLSQCINFNIYHQDVSKNFGCQSPPLNMILNFFLSLRSLAPWDPSQHSHSIFFLVFQVCVMQAVYSQNPVCIPHPQPLLTCMCSLS
jgi:hypothetical protein